jgi:hypothetical protein
MAYELYIHLPAGAPKPPAVQKVIAAFEDAELPCTEKPDKYGHWLVLDDLESSLDLTVEDGIVTAASFRFSNQDDDALIEQVAEVFKSLGFSVRDDEGEL